MDKVKVQLLLVTVACCIVAMATQAQAAAESEPLDPLLAAMYQEVQHILALLQQAGGVDDVQLTQLANNLSDLASRYLATSGVTVDVQSMKDLITEMATSYNNLASLTALFDDELSLQAAKLDSAFFLLDKLATSLTQMEKPQVYTAVGALGETAQAIAQVVAQTDQIFHYINDRARRETTVNGHVERGPNGGVSGGVSVSHTWNGRRRRNLA